MTARGTLRIDHPAVREVHDRFQYTVQRAPIQTQLKVYEYLVLDIETANGRPEDAEDFIQRTWRPQAEWKDETIGKRYREAVAHAKEKLALLDAAPVISVALKSEGELRCLHAMRAHPPAARGKALVQGFATAKEMLEALGALFASRVGPETQLVGHNVRDFDLRRLRWCFVKENLPVPRALVNRDQALYDIMQEYVWRYSVAREKMASFASILADWGLPSHKNLADGSKIPELFERGKHEAIVDYNLLDVLAEEEVYLRMR